VGGVLLGGVAMSAARTPKWRQSTAADIDAVRQEMRDRLDIIETQARDRAKRLWACELSLIIVSVYIVVRAALHV
jgi:hypothetical protein